MVSLSSQVVVYRRLGWMTVACGVLATMPGAYAQSLRWYWCENSNNVKINAIVDALEKPAPAMTFEEEPLQNVLSRWPIPIRIDEKSLEDSGITIDEPVRLIGVPGETWMTRLESVLDQLVLTWVPVGDGLQITSAEGRSGNICCLYFLPLSLASNRSELISSIESDVTPDAWECNSGSSSITIAYATADTLVVRANMQTHIRLKQYINALEQHGLTWATIGPSDRKIIKSMLTNRESTFLPHRKASSVRSSVLKETSSNRAAP